MKRQRLAGTRRVHDASFLGFSEGTPSSRPLMVRLARTNDDLTRHGDESPAMAAAHRAAGKRRRCRDLVAAVAAMVGRPCSPSSRAHPLRVADRRPRTPTPSRSSPAATRDRSSVSSRLTAFLMHGVPSLAAPWRTAGSCGSGKHGDAPPSIAGSRSVGPPADPLGTRGAPAHNDALHPKA